MGRRSLAYRKNCMYRPALGEKRKKTLTAKVNKLARIVKSRKPELKYSDATATAQQFNTDPLTSYILSPLTLITQAITDLNGRVGDKIRVHRQRMHMTLHNATYTGCTFRITVFQLRSNPDAATLKTAIGNLFFDSSYTNTVNMVNAPYDYDNRKDFVVLFDKCYTLNPQTGSTADPIITSKQITISVKPKIKEIAYSAGGVGITAGEIYWAFTSDLAASASRSASHVLRTYYTDC